MVFLGYGPRSQRNARKLNLVIERLKRYYEVSLIHVPDDVSNDLPYIRVEPLDGSEALPKPAEIDLACDFGE